jgi:hypothetical protein
MDRRGSHNRNHAYRGPLHVDPTSKLSGTARSYPKLDGLADTFKSKNPVSPDFSVQGYVAGSTDINVGSGQQFHSDTGCDGRRITTTVPA